MEWAGPGQWCTSSIGGCDLTKIAVAIPVWQPDTRLAGLVHALRSAGLHRIILVNDGSTPDRMPLLEELAALPGVTVCHHAENRGKGCALKTAFRHILHAHPDMEAVITADADGQHLPKDILRLARQLMDGNTRVLLGVRAFDTAVPWRSRIGNTLTRALFATLTGCRLRDTQTGLRGLPVALLPELLNLPGERYEYEMRVLAHLCRTGRAPVEVPIQTVYLDQNRQSHFRPVWDSLHVYCTLCRAVWPQGNHNTSTRAKDEARLRTA